MIGKRYGLEIYCPVDNAGRFTPEVEHFAGQRVFDANDPIVEFMRERGVLLFSEKYEHRYPHCWRCKNPVIFRATPQWFIAMDQAHSDLVEKDEDGRDRTNFTDNLPEGSAASLRGAALDEIERVNGFRRGASIACATCSRGGRIGASRASVFGASPFPFSIARNAPKRLRIRR